jgi:hypothetical protein
LFSTQQFHRRNFEFRPAKNIFLQKFSTVVLKTLWKSARLRANRPKKPIVYAFCTTTGQKLSVPRETIRETTED